VKGAHRSGALSSTAGRVLWARSRRGLPATIAFLVVLAALTAGLAALAGEDLYRVDRLDRHLVSIQRHVAAAAAVGDAEVTAGREYAAVRSDPARRRFAAARRSMADAITRIEDDTLDEYGYDYGSVDFARKDVRTAHDEWVRVVEARGRHGRAAGRSLRVAECRRAIAEAAQPVVTSTDPVVAFGNSEMARMAREEARACRRERPERLTDAASDRIAAQGLRAAGAELDEALASLVAAIPREERDKAKRVNAAAGRFAWAAAVFVALATIAWLLDRLRRRVPPLPRPIYVEIIASQLTLGRPSLLVGWTARIAGTVLISAATVAGFAALTATRSDLPVAGRLGIMALLAAAAALLGGAGRRFWRFGKRRLAAVAAEEVIADPRPPVLYLRSFADDPVAAQMYDAQSLFARRFGEEEQVALAMGRIGPFVGLGDPGARTPQIGATRFQLPNDDWQGRILELIDAARLVLIRLGTTESLWWEIAQAMQRLQPEQLVLLVPFARDEYAAFGDAAQTRLPHALPPEPSDEAGEPDPSSNRIRALISFDAQWQPRFVPLRVRDNQLPRAFFRELTRALRPVVTRLGIAPHRWTPVRFADVVGLGVTAGGVVLALFVFGRFAELVHP
jgi:hypothetical protein